jgi:4,5:9,10-diseco-3-hydroxy-5,9,17-trioxoandrosta-1(10),2-diene-4-oate hydrolase
MTIDPATLEPRTCDIGGRRLTYYEVGSGDPLVLIHGGGPGAAGISNYRKNIAHFARTRRVIVPDLPGFGLSEPKPSPGGLFASMAESVIELLDQLGVAKASFVGNSLGGGTALCVALARPELVDRMVLMGPGGSLPVFSPFPTEGLLRMLHFYDGSPPTKERVRRVLELLVFDQSTITEELIDLRLEAASQPSIMQHPPLKGRGANPADDLFREPLYTLTHPTLIVWGRDDRVVPLDCAFALLKTIPKAQLHVFPMCGHWVQWEKADAFNTLVTTFLDEA